MVRIMRLLCCVLGVVCVFAAPASSQEACDAVDALFRSWSGTETPGAAVAVVKDGRVVCAGAYGMANLAHGVPNTPETRFTAASISKAFTAFGVAKLAGDGQLDLDAPVSRYVTQLAAPVGDVTIRQLVEHTSGVRDHLFLLRLAGRRRGDVVTRQDIQALLYRQNSLNFPAGSRWMYSNGGYALLADVIEQVTGQPFRDWMADNVLRPHGLAATDFPGYRDEVVGDLATSYLPNAAGDYEVRTLNSDDIGGTGLTTTVGDLAAWMIALMGDETSLPGALALFRQPAVLADGTAVSRHGFGYQLSQFGGVAALGHGGRYSGRFTMFPEHGVGIAVLVNDASIFPDHRLDRIAALFVESESPRLGVDQQTCGAALADMPLREGIYAMPGANFIVNLERREGIPVFDWWGYPTVVQQCDGGYFAPGLAFPAFYDPEAPDKIRLGGLALAYRPAVPVAPEAAEELVGRYYSAELNVTYVLYRRSDTLFVHQDGQPDIPLVAVGPDAFASASRRFDTLTVERDGEGRATGLLVSSISARNLRFQRSQ